MIMMESPIRQRLRALRALMKKMDLDAYLVPSTDPHQNEFAPEFWQRRKYISGFSGSAGDVIITQSKACLWTDSRYFLQAGQELDGNIVQLYRLGLPGVPSMKEWLAEKMKKGNTLGIDPHVLSHQSYDDLQNYLKDRGFRIKIVPNNLVDAVWENRPSPSKQNIQIYPQKYAGESVKKKLARVQEKMAERSTDLLVVSALDEIAWLFNIRGQDIDYSPVVIAYALILNKKAMLFVDPDKLMNKIRGFHNDPVDIYPYEKFFHKLREISRKNHGLRAWVDPNSVNQRIVNVLKKHTKIHFSPSPILLFKAVKNKTEIQGFRAAHVRDGAAMVKFLFWLYRSLHKEQITERSAADKLAEFRAENPLFQGPSFATISAYREHSAIVHYAASPESDIPLQRRNLYLVDSGAQYMDATTDITRTICLGRPQKTQRECFTQVLKGLITLSSTSFPQGTAGSQLDSIARLPLWKKGRDYGHGTGHGIGTYLNVHEGPHAISPQQRTGVALEPGMITTIEPGIYFENKYGIRLENVVLIEKDDILSGWQSIFYRFETLTLCPIDLKLVKKEVLNQEEIDWLNAYHKRIRQTISPLIDKREKDWLAKSTRPI
jgi:Xaa-Pro aminopeptidase